MELREIREICREIAELIEESGKGLIYRDYETFLSWFNMEGRRDFKVLTKIDRQLKNLGITFWAGCEQLHSVADFKRGQRITFRISGRAEECEDITEIPQTRDNGKKTVGNKNAGKIIIEKDESGLEFFKHQKEAIENLQTKINKSGKVPYEGLLVLPTGGGKTLTAAYWLARDFLGRGKKVLWIAHRHELLEQAAATFHGRLAFKDVFNEINSFNYRLVSGIHDKPVDIKPTDDIIISSKDSLNAGFDHLARNWLKDTRELFLVIDEAHHATAKTYRRLINAIKAEVDVFRMIGLTATPFRTAIKEEGLLARVFPDDIVYKIDMRTLIKQGILSQPIFENVDTDCDMTQWLSQKELEDLNYYDIEAIGKKTAKNIAENDDRNWKIVERYTKNKAKYRQTLVFAMNQDNAIALNKLFEKAQVRSAYVISSIKDAVTGVTISSKENKEKIDRFRKGDLEVLINVNILTEGTDLPNVQSVFLARPTVSSVLMTQMLGRGLRGPEVGGTKEAYIVSFIDKWNDLVNWVNPERLVIQENATFDDDQPETRKQIIRLVAIEKIEEFAILTDKIINNARKEQLEKLNFIERIPVGLYHFSFTNQDRQVGEREKNCEILVYDNLRQSYEDFVNALPSIFSKNGLMEVEMLSDEKLNELAEFVETEFFSGCSRCPAYFVQDIRDVLQYFAEKEVAPRFIELKDRAKYDITRVAAEILKKNLGRKDEEEYKNSLWESHEVEWQAFFGYDKKYFLAEIDLAIRKLTNPNLYERHSVIPQNVQEQRKLEDMSMAEIREHSEEYWKWLSDQVYARHRDSDGFYTSATKDHKSKNKLDFQIDHIKPRHNGGKTTLDNLQLLTRRENAIKGRN